MLEYDEWVVPGEMEYAERKAAQIEAKIQKCREGGLMTLGCLGMFPCKSFPYTFRSQSILLRDLRLRFHIVDGGIITNICITMK